jgi:hypothetical protein
MKLMSAETRYEKYGILKIGEDKVVELLPFGAIYLGERGGAARRPTPLGVG